MKKILYAIGVFVGAAALIFAGANEKEALELIPGRLKR